MTAKIILDICPSKASWRQKYPIWCRYKSGRRGGWRADRCSVATGIRGVKTTPKQLIFIADLISSVLQQITRKL